MNLRQTIDHKIKTIFCMKKFSCIKTILFQKNFTIQIQWFVSRILTIVCICLCMRVYMAICECVYMVVCVAVCVCVRSEYQCANCFKKIHHIQYARSKFKLCVIYTYLCKLISSIPKRDQIWLNCIKIGLSQKNLWKLLRYLNWWK